MKATVKIDKSFIQGKEFSKEWNDGDFEQFFKEEGAYLDNLSNVLWAHGNDGESFTVTYTVTVTR